MYTEIKYWPFDFSNVSKTNWYLCTTRCIYKKRTNDKLSAFVTADVDPLVCHRSSWHHYKVRLVVPSGVNS